jgi:hypothetical protein
MPSQVAKKMAAHKSPVAKPAVKKVEEKKAKHVSPYVYEH